MQEKTFYRGLFIGLIVITFVTLTYMYRLIEPLPTIEYEIPEIPEVPNLRDPRDCEKLEEYIPFTIDPLIIWINVGITAAVLMIIVITYYRRKEEY